MSRTVAACGGDDGGQAASGSKTLDVYITLPFEGASKTRSEDMLLGAKIALRQANNTAGKFKVKLVSEDNSLAQSGKWDPGATSTAARKATQDDAAIAYLGELNSGASAVSIPILNEAGILQVSAANTAVGLTRPEGAEPGEPDKDYPSGKRTRARRARRPPPGRRLLAVHGRQRLRVGVHPARPGGLRGGLGQAGAEDRPDQGHPGQGLRQHRGHRGQLPLARGRHRQLGRDLHVLRRHHGQQRRPALQGHERVTTPTLPPDQYPPEGQALYEELRKAKGGGDPDTYALYAYEAMNAILLAIETAGENGDDRQAVVDAFFKIKDRQSVLGTYSIDTSGDTTLKSYGGNRIKDGHFVFDKVIAL